MHERARSLTGLLLLVPLLLPGCSTGAGLRVEPATTFPVTPALTAADPAEAGFDPALPMRLDSTIDAAIAAGGTPGAAIAVGRHGRLVHMRGYGQLDWADGSADVDPASIYDMASLTKVVATTTAAMLLEEDGLLDLDRPIRAYLPELDSPDKAAITTRLLLEHRSGLAAGGRLWEDLRSRDEYLSAFNEHPLEAPPGEQVRYSDWGMILVGFAIERIAGQPLDQFVRERVFQPLGMHDTGFNPEPDRLARVAPTEIDTVFRYEHVHGYVHDENAWALGGVAGHAGLFSSARDLATFAQMMLNGGELDGVRVLDATTIARWTAPQNVGSSRALGWDTPSPESSAGRYFSSRAFGHTGFTGTSIWIDPERGLFVILLTNRVNPARANQAHVPLRRAIADAVHEAITDAPLVDWESRH